MKHVRGWLCSVGERFRAVLGAVAIVIGVSAPGAAQERPTVVTVNYALSYFAERLGGGDIDVVFPVPDGVDPSFWRPALPTSARSRVPT